MICEISLRSLKQRQKINIIFINIFYYHIAIIHCIYKKILKLLFIFSFINYSFHYHMVINILLLQKLHKIFFINFVVFNFLII